MQEFSSISVSSYEAGALADQLTEQSGAGWSVVAIVPTGSTVTAYLSRPADGAAADSSATPASVATPAAEPAETTAATDATSEAAPADDSTDTDPVADAAGWAAGASTAAAETATTAATETADDHFTVAAEPAAEAAPAAMSAASSGAGAAPAGWYADPSSRFELRYWDGSQWTEHVSRAGQQYTDPPVA